jgi:7-cyano-7-deazaguanine synthase
MTDRKLAVVLVSGGLDSVTLAYKMKAEGYELVLLNAFYGQKHKKEMEFARRAAEALGAEYHVVDLSFLPALIAGSSTLLGNSGESVPEGHYAEESMRATVVPNRNAIFLSVAFSVAAAKYADVVATAVHGGDHFIYPDCRPNFIGAFAAMERWSLEGAVRLEAPFLHATKADIAREAGRLGVPIHETWSCYAGGEIHCGRCGTCVERLEAVEEAGVKDDTPYADTAFWQEALQRETVALDA